MAASAQPPPFDLNTSFGAVLIAVIVAAALWGISVVQGWYYFSRYPKDFWYIKLLVAVTLVFDTIHQALITHAIYWYTITSYGNPDNLGKVIWSIVAEVAFNGFVGFLVQGFFTYRVYRLSNRNLLVTGVLGALELALTGIQIAYAIMSLHFVNSLDLHKLKALSMSINSLGALIDVLIAFALFYFLHRSRTGFKQTDSMISRLMLFTINTGLLTSICAVLCLATFIIYPDDLIYVTFFFCMGRLYCNSLLATLNCRPVTHGPSGGDRDSTLSPLGPASSKGARNASVINVITSEEFTPNIKQSAITQYPPERYVHPGDDKYEGDSSSRSIAYDNKV